MNEFGACGIEPVELKSLQQRELLQHHRALAPDAGLADGVAAVIVGQRRLDGRLPARHVVATQHAAMRRAADVHDVLRAAELVDRFGDKAMRPRFARAFDLRDAVGAGAFRLLQDAGIGFREFLVGEQRAGFGHFIVRQIDRGRGGPVLPEQLLDDLDRCRCAFDQRIAVAGIGDGRFEHVAQPQRAVVAQQQHPGFERAGNAGRQQPGAGHHLQAFAAIMRDGRAGGAGPWPQITSVRPRLVSCTMIGTSPPGPFRCGSTTCSVNAVATPASKALPPFSRVAIPTAVAIQWVEVTTPKVPSISGRVVNGSGLILLIGIHASFDDAVGAAHLTTAKAACQPAADALGSHPRDHAGAAASS